MRRKKQNWTFEQLPARISPNFNPNQSRQSINNNASCLTSVFSLKPLTCIPRGVLMKERAVPSSAHPRQLQKSEKWSFTFLTCWSNKNSVGVQPNFQYWLSNMSFSLFYQHTQRHTPHTHWVRMCVCALTVDSFPLFSPLLCLPLLSRSLILPFLIFLFYSPAISSSLISSPLLSLPPLSYPFLYQTHRCTSPLPSSPLFPSACLSSRLVSHLLFIPPSSLPGS